MWNDLTSHWLKLFTAIGLFGLVVFFHLHANPHLMFLLFYAVPCALVALIVNTRWATLFALAAAVVAPLVQFEGDTDYQSGLVFTWNLLSRFILLEMAVLTLGRIRLEFKKTGFHVK